MMMATRFRSMGWVGCVAAAALGCYLVSQRVATERGSVDRLDRQIVMAKLDIRKLETELGTRSRMPVLEQWNAQVLALSAPSANQYLHGEVQLARFEPGRGIPSMEDRAAPVRTTEAQQPARVIPVVASEPAPAAAPAEPMLRHASYVKPSDGEFAANVRPAALLDSSVLADLQSAAQREKRGSSGER
jgi:hypothetical protein